jgi:hypothetical protein
MSSVTMRDVGWVWEGQGLDPGVPPSIFGVGEGCAYFGLSRAVYIFHPNDDLGLRKLSHLDEVACDISKWKYYEHSDPFSVYQRPDARPETIRAEAARVSELSRRYPNVTGGFHDDMLGLARREGLTPQQYGAIYDALHSANPALKLWVVVYTHELKPDTWEGFAPFIDVVNLWIWNAKDIPTQDENIALCRRMFPGKPINVGCYLRDYPTAAPVPMDMLRLQWEGVRRNLDRGLIDGYSILGTVLIDGQQQQAEWVRRFISEH